MTTYAVALGSNLGPRVGHLRSAVTALGSLGAIRAVSSLYETAPVGGPPQDPYLNAVVVIDSELPPAGLLDSLERIEADHQRVRETRWGPRTLDLDIVAMSPGEVSTDRLTVPHPRSSERRFVLDPLSEVWPEAVVAGGTTAVEALTGVSDQEVDLLSRSWLVPSRRGVYWVAAQVLIFAALGVALVLDGSLPTRIGPNRWAGAVILLAGAWLMLSSVSALGSSLTALPEPREGGTLVERGPYARARHPIYGGVVLTLVGASLFLASPIGVTIATGLGVFFWFKSIYEESELRIAYAGYAAYRTRVRRRIIPYLL